VFEAQTVQEAVRQAESPCAIGETLITIRSVSAPANPLPILVALDPPGQQRIWRRFRSECTVQRWRSASAHGITSNASTSMYTPLFLTSLSVC
jgi:hypothetical protein